MGFVYAIAGRRWTVALRNIAFWVSLLTAALVAESAWALTCTQVSGRTIQENDGNPATFSTESYMVTLEPGQSITYQATALAGGAQVNILVNGFLVHDNPNTSYTLSNPGATALTVTVQVFVHETRLVATGSCGGTSIGDEAGAKRDALQKSVAGARPDSDPDNLPGSGESEFDPCEFVQNLYGKLITRREELEFELQALSVGLVNVRNRQLSEFPGESYVDKLANREQTIKDLSKRTANISGQLGLLKDEIEDAKKRVKDCLASQGIFDSDIEELGDGEQILYAPVAERFGRSVPWPVTALGYADQPLTTISTAREYGFAVGGRPSKLWVRAQGSILDGTLGRTGTAGSLQAGFVIGVTGAVDIGLMAHILAGTVQSSTIGGSLSSVAGAVGLYTKINLANGFNFGLSGLHEWGGHNITLGGATGFYTSSFWSVSAAVSRPFLAGAWIVTPALSGTWNQINNGGYTDSNGLVVPATTDSKLYFTGKINLARPVVRSGEHIQTVTPRLSVAANYFAQPGRNLALGAPGTLTSSSFTIDLEAGLALVLAGGGTVDFAVQARGLAGNERSYGLQAGVRLPIN